MQKTTRIGVIAAILLLFVAGGTPRAWGRSLSIDDCARRANVIFIGTVVDVKSRWGGTGKLIWTDYVFQVQETWKGKQGEALRTVSVGGGTIGGKTIKLTEVPSFELGATYVVYAFDNDKHFAEAVVGVDQGLFREVEDADSGKRFLIDAQGYRLEELQDQRVVKGRLTQRVGGEEKAHVMTDEELINQQELFEAKQGPPPLAPPVVRDAAGNRLATEPPPVKTAREKAVALIKSLPSGTPLNRERLKIRTFKALGLAPTTSPATTSGGTTP